MKIIRISVHLVEEKVVFGALIIEDGCENIDRWTVMRVVMERAKLRRGTVSMRCRIECVGGDQGRAPSAQIQCNSLVVTRIALFCDSDDTERDSQTS